MGWTTTYKPPHIKTTEYLLHHSGALSWGADGPATYTVLDTAIVNLKTFYAAVERIDKTTGERRVWAAIFLLGYWRSGNENFGWKDMSEDMGPCEATCPERILDLLTPTDCINSNDWRARCRAAIATRKTKPKIRVGCTLNLYGKPYTVTAPQGKRGFWLKNPEGQTYTASHVKLRQATDIEQP